MQINDLKAQTRETIAKATATLRPNTPLLRDVKSI